MFLKIAMCLVLLALFAYDNPAPAPDASASVPVWNFCLSLSVETEKNGSKLGTVTELALELSRCYRVFSVPSECLATGEKRCISFQEQKKIIRSSCLTVPVNYAG